jgi:LAO/AO transport system kinase
MLTLGTMGTLQGKPAWQVPVVGVSAYTGHGIDELLARIVRHRGVLADTDLGLQRRRRVAAFRLEKTAQTMLLERFANAARDIAPPLADTLAVRGIDPYAAAHTLIARTLRKEYADDLA